MRLLERPDDAGVLQRAASGNGPVFLKLDHLRRGDDPEIETILHTQRAAQPRPLPRRARHRLPQRAWSRCTSPRSASAAGTAPRACGSTSTARPRCRACMPPATWRACRTTTCSAPSSTAGSPARTRPRYCAEARPCRVRCGRGRRRERARVLAPTRREDGIPPNQVEYKMRRLVNDYLQPPKVTRKMRDRPAALRRDPRGPGAA